MTIAVHTEELGGGWWGSANEDGSFTLRNPDKGQRIDLTEEEAAKFVDLWVQAGGGESEQEYFQQQQGKL